MTPTKAGERRSYAKSTILSSLDSTPFIGGEYSSKNATRHRLPITDPYSQELLLELEEASEEDVLRAVETANKSFDSGVWSGAHPRSRALVLMKLADLIDSMNEEIALLEALDTGKRFAGTRAWDIPNAAEVFRYYAGLCDKIAGEKYPSVGSYRFFSEKAAIGVVAAIMPWNFPFACLAWKLGPALAAGCSVVVKSAERAPLTTQLFPQLAVKAGIPPGVVNVLPGRGETTGIGLASNSLVNKITFTGSTETGIEIVQRSSPNLPRLSLELGGKSPNVIMEDADVDRALSGAIGAIFDVAGQNCLAGSRTFVHAKIYDEFAERLVALTSKRRLGDNFDDKTEQGPQIDEQHVSRIEGFINRASNEGAKILIGGKKSTVGPTFFEPTLVECSRDDMEIVREEVFGPVGGLHRFDDLDEVISRANNTKFGLAAAIWTRNAKSADQFASKIQAGTIWINCYGMIDTGAPWGGFRSSGYGKELGWNAIEDFLETKVVFQDISV